MYIVANDAVNQPTQVNGLPVDKLAMCPIPEGPEASTSVWRYFTCSPEMHRKQKSMQHWITW